MVDRVDRERLASLALELVAGMALDTLALALEMAAIPGPLQEKHFSRKHGPGAYYGQR